MMLVTTCFLYNQQKLPSTHAKKDEVCVSLGRDWFSVELSLARTCWPGFPASGLEHTSHVCLLACFSLTKLYSFFSIRKSIAYHCIKKIPVLIKYKSGCSRPDRSLEGATF